MGCYPDLFNCLFGNNNMNRGFRIRLVLLGACGLCLLVLLLFEIVIWRQPRVPALDIRFTGFTNAPGQLGSAVFRVTNRSRRPISFVTLAPQVRIEGAWSDVVPPGPLAISLVLEGHQGTNIAVTIPNGGQAWRVPILWCYSAFSSPAEFYLRRVASLLRTAKQGSLSGWKYGWGLGGHTNFSAEIASNVAEQDGAANRSQPVHPQPNQTSAAAGSGR
jgi:hypothetical protein